ncbi:MAG: hypothetical protein ABWZ57_02170 [Mesorhizobium sp.]
MDITATKTTNPTSSSRRRGSKQRDADSPTTNETAEAYGRVVLRWDYSQGKATRIIVCRNALQWIIQYRAPSGGWRAQSFCRMRATLERLLPGKAKEIRAALPERLD